MKTLLIILAFGIAAKAQSPKDFLSQYGATTDTLTVDTVTAPATKNLITTRQNAIETSMSIALHIAKSSGKARGHAYLQGSLDGSHYSNLSTAHNYTIKNVTAQDTVWKFRSSPVIYYRLQFVSDTVSVCIVKAQMFAH